MASACRERKDHPMPFYLFSTNDDPLPEQVVELADDATAML
jgi:hypothetical protein